jgi:hypothetical protein
VSEQPGKQDEVLHPGQVLVDRGELAGEADLAADGVRLPHHVVAEHAGLAAVGAQQGGEHPDRGGLARAVRPEQAVHRAGRHAQVDAVEGAGGAERPDQTRRLDRQVG